MPRNFQDLNPDTLSAPPETTRLSFLAIGALVTGILSFAACCIPIHGLIPAVLGIAGIIVVSRSRGRLAGRGMSIAGLVLGVASLAISSFLWIGVSMTAGRMGPAYSQLLSDDPAVVRTVLSSKTNAKLTDEQIAEFERQFQADYGDAAQLSFGVLPLVKAYLEAGDPSAYISEAHTPGEGVFPLPVKTNSGWIYITVLMHQGEVLGSGVPAVADVGFVSADRSRTVWLVGKPAERTLDTSPTEGSSDEGESPPSPPTPDPGG